MFVLLQVGERSRTFAYGDRVVVGCGDDADLRLHGDDVSAVHLRVHAAMGAVLVEDVHRGTPPRTVRSLETVDVGDYALRFSVDDTAFITLADPIEQELLDAVAASPADAATRSVYADWLESVGGWAHAEFLRTQLALSDARDAGDPAFQAASARLAQLATRLEPAWRARVAVAFVEACPSELARRNMFAVTITHDRAEHRLVFAKPEVELGTHVACDIKLDSSKVSERHARIVLRDERTIVVDLKSATGVFINARRITGPVMVRPADIIEIAAFTIRIGKAEMGERPVAGKTLGMELVCPQRWDQLAPTRDGGVRHCNECNRDVSYCTTIEQARRVAAAGGCVAIDVRNVKDRRPGDLRQPERPMMLGVPAPYPREPPPAPPPRRRG